MTAVLTFFGNCSELENLHINGVSSTKEYDLSEIISLNNIKTVCIPYSKVVNASEVLKLPNFEFDGKL